MGSCLIDKLKFGDILIFNNPGYFKRAIKILWPESKATHAAIYMGDNILWEVTFPRARFSDLQHESGLIAIKRFSQLTDKNATDIYRYIALLNNRPYDLFQVVGYALWKIFGHMLPNSKFSDVCTSGVARVYAGAGISLFDSSLPITPDDILNSNKLETV